MNCNDIIQGDIVILRNITLADCTERYVNWMNDKKINKYLESRFSIQTMESVKQYVQNIKESNDSYMFAIIYRETNEHIGNIKIGPIHKIYKHTFVGHLIGDKNYWGSGAATDALYLAVKFCFKALSLHKVNAGVIASNMGAIRILEELGFNKEACIRDDVLLDDKYFDVYRYGVLESELISPTFNIY